MLNRIMADARPNGESGVVASRDRWEAQPGR